MARLGRVTDPDGEALTESEVSKISKAYKEVGISLYDATGSFMGMEEAMSQLHEKWGSLNDAQKNYIAEQSAGSRQLNTFKIWMDNYDRIQELTQNAKESQGTTLKNQEIYNDTYTAQIQNFKTATDELKLTLFDSDLTKDFIELGTTGVNAVTSLIKPFKSLGTIIAAIGAAKGLDSIGKILAGKEGKNKLGGMWGLTKSVGGFFKTGYSSIGSAIGDVFGKSAVSTAGAGLAAMEGEAAAATAAVGGLSTAIAGVGTALLTVYAIYKTGKFISDSIKQYKIDKADKATKSWNDSQAILDTENVRGLREQLDSSTNDAQTLSLKEQIYSIQSQIVDQYGAQASGIDLVNGDLETQIALLEQISSQKAQDLLKENKGVYDDAKSHYYGLNKRYDAYDYNGVFKNTNLNSDLEKIANKYDNVSFVRDESGLIGFDISGNATEVHNATESLLSDLSNLQGYDHPIFNGLIEYLQDGYDETKEIIQDYGNNAKTAVDLEIQSIPKMDDYKSAIKLIDDYKKSAKEFNEAVKTGNDQDIQEKQQALSDSKNVVDNYVSDLQEKSKTTGDNSFNEYADATIEKVKEIDGTIDQSALKLQDYIDIINGDGKIRPKNQFANDQKKLEKYTNALKDLNAEAVDFEGQINMNNGLGGLGRLIGKALGFDTENNEDVKALSKMLVDAGVLKDGRNAPQTQQPETQISTLKSMLLGEQKDKNFTESASQFVAETNTIQGAIDNLRSGKPITSTDLFDLKNAIPELTSYGDAINDVDKLQSALRESQAKSLLEYKKQYEDVMSSDTYSKEEKDNFTSYYKDSLKALVGKDIDWSFISEKFISDNIASGMNVYEASRQAYSQVAEMIDATTVKSYSEAVSATSTQLSNYQSRMSTLAQAQQEFNKTGKLSVQTMQSLRDSGIDATDAMKDGFHSLINDEMDDFLAWGDRISDQLTDESQKSQWKNFIGQAYNEMIEPTLFRSTAVDDAKTSLSVITSAISEMNSETGLTSETIQGIFDTFTELDKADFGKVFETTAKGVKVNADALKDLSKKQFAVREKGFQNDIDQQTKAILNATKGSKEYENSLENLRKTQMAQAEAYANYQKEQAQLTNFALWQQAQSEAKQGAEYDTIQGALKSAKEQIDKGMYNTPDLQAMGAMLSSTGMWLGKDALLRDLQTANKYFTENSAQGMQQFIDDSLAKSIMQRTEDGGLKLNVGSYQDVAEALSISNDMARAIVGKAQEYGLTDTLADSMTEATLKYNERVREISNLQKKISEGGMSESDLADAQTRLASLNEELGFIRESVAQNTEKGRFFDDIQKGAETATNSVKNYNDQVQAILDDSTLTENQQKQMINGLDFMLQDLADGMGVSYDYLKGMVDESGKFNDKKFANTISTVQKLQQMGYQSGYDFDNTTIEQANEYLGQMYDTREKISNQLLQNPQDESLIEQYKLLNDQYEIGSKAIAKREVQNARDKGYSLEEMSNWSEADITANVGLNADVDAFKNEVQSEIDGEEASVKVSIDQDQFVEMIEAITGKPYEIKVKTDQNNIKNEARKAGNTFISEMAKNSSLGESEGFYKNYTPGSAQLGGNITGVKVSVLADSTKFDQEMEEITKPESKVVNITQSIANPANLPKSSTTTQTQNVIKKETLIRNVQTTSSGDASSAIKNAQSKISGGSATIKINGDNSQAIAKGRVAQNTINGLSPTIKINGDNSQAIAKGRVAKNEIEGLNPQLKITADTSIAKYVIDAFISEQSRRSISLKVSAAGASGTMTRLASGTVQNSGSAYNVTNLKPLSSSYANGTSVGLPHDEKALTNELGQESILRGNKWYLLPGGPHVENLKKGDVIFNVRQTKDLLEHGKTKYYASAYEKDYSKYINRGAKSSIPSHANGTVSGMKAYSAGWDANALAGISKNTSSSTNSGAGAGAINAIANAVSNSLEDFKKWQGNLFDWIKVKLDYLGKQASNYYTKAENFIAQTLTRNYSSAFKNIQKAINKVTEQISNNRLGYARYMQQADTVNGRAQTALTGTDLAAYNDAVNRLNAYGVIDISEYSEDVRTVLGEYQKWFDLAQDCKFAIDELNKTQIDYSKTLYNLPIDMANEKMEKLTTTADNLKKLSELSTGTGLQNFYIGKELQAVVDSKNNEEKLKKAQQDLEKAKQEYAAQLNDPLAYAQSIAVKTYRNVEAQNKVRTKELELAQKNQVNATTALADASKELDAQKNAIKKLGLGETVNNAVANGENISLRGYTGNQYNALVAYNSAVDQANKANTALQVSDDALAQAEQDAFISQVELTEARLEYAQTRFNNIKDFYEYQSTYEKTVRENLKNSGKYLNSNQFDDELKIQRKEAEKLQKQLDSLVSTGFIKEGSKEWAEMTEEIIKVKDTIIDLENEAYESHLEVMFDNAIKSADILNERLSSIKSIITSEMMFDRDTGHITEMGLFNVAISKKEMDTAINDLNDYVFKRNDILSKYKDKYGKTYEYGIDSTFDKWMNDVDSSINSAIQNANGAKQAITGLIKQQAQEEVNAIKKVIDARKTSLQAKESYYDYDKKLRNKNQELQSLKAQINALNGVADAQTKAKKAKLEAQLKEKQDDFEDVLTQHVYEVQIKGLEELSKNLDEDLEKYTYELSSNLQKATDAIGMYTKNTEISAEKLNELLKFVGLGYANGKYTTTNTGVVGGGSNQIMGYANGTSYHPGGAAIINEGGSAEMIQLPDGTILMPYAPKGMKVMSAEMTRNAFAVANSHDIIQNATKSSIPTDAFVTSRQASGDTIINSSINIDGNVDHHTFDELKNYIESRDYKSAMSNYTIKEIVRDARKNGVKA